MLAGTECFQSNELCTERVDVHVCCLDFGYNVNEVLRPKTARKAREGGRVLNGHVCPG